MGRPSLLFRMSTLCILIFKVVTVMMTPWTIATQLKLWLIRTRLLTFKKWTRSQSRAKGIWFPVR